MQTRLPNGQIVYQEDYSCIIEPQNGKGGIFIGNLEAAQNLKTLKKHSIKAILTAAKGVDLTHSKTDIPFYLQVPGEDRDGFDMTRFFLQSVNFIKDALESTSIMVHCLAGVSRSVCLVLAYFIKYRGFSYDEAYNLVKMKRSIIHPNDGFISQLRKYESQIRANGGSPTRYENTESPTKKRYDYYYQCDQNRNNPQIYKYQQPYMSPSKKTTIQASYEQIYQSPTKKSFMQLVDEGYDKNTTANRLYGSPVKRRIAIEDQSSYEPAPLQLRKLQSYKERSEYNQYQMRHISPERRRMTHNIDNKGRSNSIIENKQPKNAESSRLYGNYDRLRHASAVELSEELDSKIAAIRQKYSEYTKNQLTISRRISGRQSQPRVNNYIDENEISLSTNIGMKKISSDYQGIGSGISNRQGRQYGMISNNFNRTSGIGLGLRRLNSMRQGY